MDKSTAYKWEDWATSEEHSRLMDFFGFLISVYVLVTMFQMGTNYWLVIFGISMILSFSTSTVPYIRLFFWPMFAILVPYYTYTDPQSIYHFFMFQWHKLHFWVPNGLVGTIWLLLAMLSTAITSAYGDNWKYVGGITLLSQLFKK